MSTQETNEIARRLKEYRKSQRMSQVDFAAFIGIPYRTYQNYESGSRYPKNMAVINKLATALGTTSAELIGAAGGYIGEDNANEQCRMEQTVAQLSAMFSSNEIEEAAKDAAMAALSEAYWKHKLAKRERFTTNATKAKKAKRKS